VKETGLKRQHGKKVLRGTASCRTGPLTENSRERKKKKGMVKLFCKGMKKTNRFAFWGGWGSSPREKEKSSTRVLRRRGGRRNFHDGKRKNIVPKLENSTVKKGRILIAGQNGWGEKHQRKKNSARGSNACPKRSRPKKKREGNERVKRPGKGGRWQGKKILEKTHDN